MRYFVLLVQEYLKKLGNFYFLEGIIFLSLYIY